MFKRRDWNYLHGDGVRRGGDDSDSSSMESIGGVVDLSSTSASEEGGKRR
jgi:hypothetical protein